MKEVKWIVLSSCLLFIMFIGHGRACEPGVFGLNCTNQCHCRSGDCNEFGECKDGCEDGWGGIHCNYRDAAFHKSRSPLTDNNETTCLDSNPYYSHMYFLLSEETKLSWVRFNLKKQDVFKHAKISFLDSSYVEVIPFTMRTIVDGYNVDMYNVDDLYLWMNRTIKYVKIFFSVLDSKQYFCGMFVSGGRNVAFKQPVSLKSTYRDLAAERAVDGVRDGNLNNNHCASTYAEESAWLSFKRKHPMEINFIEIYNRDVLQCRLKRFKLWLVNGYEWDYAAQVHHDQEREPQNVYKVFATTPQVIRWVFLAVNKQYWGNDESRICGDWPYDNILTVCELEVYGEVICPWGRYGYDCEKKCHVNCLRGCHVETGYCHNCEQGSTGRYCEIPDKSALPSYASTEQCSDHNSGLYDKDQEYVGILPD